ncbi:MHS family MFS transporter [Kibdelosporangium philippinense]|uniref:MHS family MFS transporter n=1 Tax=Kibdelosporangium philippinense TaxID=211113 RepID=A0ABS8ZR76_9PSEU|nr:MFS transporter [Kibdelosporangium philippinense]MCE7010229.1 MHS family MFS transporter [Kibdelosporangium philippinense]
MSVSSSTVSPTRGRKAAVAAMAAASIEWYDFFIYATAAALVFGKVFFPGVSPVSAILASFATFGVGFAARPLGGVVFGHFGDKLGRKPMLVASLLLMAVSTTLIGLLPTYATIGVFAPFALVLLRICQGLAIGGQWGGAMLLAIESAPPGKRGLYGSFAQVGVPIGMVLGNTVFLVVAAFVSPAQFDAWGWRVPFLLSSVTALVAFYVHRRIDDPHEYTQPPGKRRSPVIEVVRQHPKAVLFASSVYIVLSAAFYILAAGLLDYGTRTLGIPKSSMLLAVLVSVSSMVLTLPLFAALSDRVGRKPVFAVGAVATGISIFAVFPLVETLNVGLAILGLVITMTTIAMMYGPQAALFAEMFPAHLRYSGASLGYQIANVIGGGFAPFVMVLLLESTGSSMSVAVYVAVLAVIALVALAFISDNHEVEARQ